MDGDTLTIILTILGSAVTILGAIVGLAIALARLAARTIERLDADRRAADDRHERAMSEWRAGMDVFRKEMQRLAERQSHVEGRFEAGSGNAAD